MGAFMIEKYNKPFVFYGLSLLIPWILWFTVAYLSHLESQTQLFSIIEASLGLIGLISPVLIACYLFILNKELLKDISNRFWHIKNVKLGYYLLTLLLIPISIVLAQVLSLLIGHSLDQFHISGNPTFSSTFFSPWFILILAPVVEELAWHSYGTDALRMKFNLIVTSIIFSVYWVIWHVPLSFIKGYYHSNVVSEGLIYSCNFVISLFVFVILMNWIYYKTKRNVTVAIIFHLTANISNEIFNTHPDSKVIQTGILLIVAIIVLIKDREMFFNKLLKPES